VSAGPRRRLSSTLLLGALLAGAALPAHAQQNVTRMVIGFPAGASFDALGRLLADRMRTAIGQAVIVENRPGVAGTLAAEGVARAAPDGRTFLLTPLASMVTEPQANRRNVRYDPFRDFAPVSLVATFEMSLVAGPAAPAKSLAEYVQLVKADREKGFFGSPGPNTLPHFFGLAFGRAAGVEMTHVPFAGPAPAIQAVLGGQVPAIVAAYSDFIKLHQAGKMRILATTGAARPPPTPEVPTFRELGFDIEATSWYAVFLPAAAPKDVVERLNRAVHEAVGSREVAEYLASTGQTPAPSTPAALTERLKRDYAKWGEVIRASGIKLE
jgi:tripartite-type tricarboxylate transporter receptor subunit TctC